MKEYYIDVISDGICMGNAVVLNFNINSSHVQKSIAEEKNKLNIALSFALEELSKIDVKKNEEFIQVHKMLLTDQALKDEILYEIEYNGKSAFDANEIVFDKYIRNFKQSKSKYLKERYLDFLDIKERINRSLCNQKIDFDNYYNIILVVDELLPSLLVDYKEKVKGVICRNGGFTSHAAILCRSLGIPCVVLKEFDIHSSDRVIIDTRRSLAFVEPEIETIEHYKEIIEEIRKEDFSSRNHDGYTFLCNVSSNCEIEKCLEYSFDGIGLYRTEFIFMNSDRPFSMEEQHKIYKEAVMQMMGKPVCFRTFDVGDDKQFDFLTVKSKGVRNYINNPGLFEDQIRALITANIYGNMKIMFPMIETVEQFIFLRNWVLQVKEELHDTNPIQIGMMLETKQALNSINRFGAADFISLGTNDLTKELYQISRKDKQNYLDFFDDLLSKLKPVVEFCNREDICLSVCGELASVRDATRGFISIGIKNFSVSAPNIKTLYLAIERKVTDESKLSHPYETM